MTLLGLLTVALLGYMYADSLIFIFDQWGSDDYSHGLFVPIISVTLIWQRRQRLVAIGIEPSWWGPPIVLTGLLLYIIGNLATVYIVTHVSLWLVIAGIVISFIGPIATGKIAFPLFYLLTSIPLPDFLYNSLSSQLQLWSSALGVDFLQAIGVTAFREGNVIDLGPVQGPDELRPACACGPGAITQLLLQGRLTHQQGSTRYKAVSTNRCA